MQGRRACFLVVLAVFQVTVRNTYGNDCHQGWYIHDGVCYGFGEDTVTWGDAEEYCRLYNSHLAEIDSADENTFLKNLARTKQASAVWIGGTDIFSEGNWEWVTSQTLISGFTDWAPNEPNDLRGEDCIMLDKGKNYQWNDIGCENTYNFVCEAEPGGGMIIG